MALSGFLAEIVAKLVADGVGTGGTDIFVSSKSVLPDGDGPYISLHQTSGFAPLRTQNSVSAPAYIRPSAQVVVRASVYSVAQAKAQAVYNSLTGVRNTTLSGTFYREIEVQQEPSDMGQLDAKGRAQVVFNFTAIKQPS